MTDKTIEQLQDEIQRLQEKNAQLIAEKRKAQTERDEVADRLASVEKERDEVAGKYKHLTVDLPRLDVLEAVAMPGMSEVLQRELGHHYDVVRAELHRLAFQLERLAVLAVEIVLAIVSADGITSLYNKRGLPIGAMLRGSGATGGGATGGKRTHQERPSDRPAAPAVSFGMR